MPNVEIAIRRTLELESSDAETRYYYNKVDLNGDNKPEVLVYVVVSSVCGTGGCNNLIFKPVGQTYQLVSEISVTRQPIIVTEQKTNGWNNLIILASGGGARASYWLVQFNGRKYADSPFNGIEVRSNSTITGRAFIANDLVLNRGIVLKADR